MDHFVQAFLLKYSYLNVYLLTVFYFLFLYFIIGWLFNYCCEALRRLNITELIVASQRPAKQTKQEIKHSLISILVFGFSSFPVIFLYRNGFFKLEENTVSNILLGLLALNVWNEIHFFCIHRLMHLPFFLRHVHKIHHQSKIPSVWSVYSFHWLEAFLLSTVPLTLSLMFSLAPLAIALYPLNSILFNFSGHCNYRFASIKNTWLNMASRHVEHHQKTKVSFGFVSALLDKLFSTNKSSKI